MNDNTAQPLWQPSRERIKASNLKRFAESLERELGKRFNDYESLHAWSCEASDVFGLRYGDSQRFVRRASGMRC